MIDSCQPSSFGRRRNFWATTLDCGQFRLCGAVCGTPGMKLLDENGKDFQTGPFVNSPATIDNTDWITSLVINMFFTNGRQAENDCGHRPGTRGGHWTDSFRTDGQTAGSLIRQIPQGIEVRQAARLVNQYAEMTLQKLITYGVAVSFDVESEYVGSGVIALNITVSGSTGENARVGINAERLTNGWVWRTQR